MTERKPSFEGARWRKSNISSDTGCVEVAYAEGWVGVRDTKDGDSGPVLAFTEHEWNSFLSGVASKEFTLQALAE